MPDASDRSAETFRSEGFVEFLHTGQAVAGEFYCSGCGYGVIVELELPRCPMCSGTAWERPGWGAFRRRLTEQLQ
jgi:rubrerythrin